MKLIPFRKNEKWGYSDENKNLIIPYQFDKATPFFEERAIVSIANNSSFRSAVINKQGELLCEFVYDTITRFQEWRARVQKEGKWGVIDDKGNLIVPLIYDGIGEYSCSRAVVLNNGLLGFINLEGELITGIEFEECTDFKEGFASVQKNAFWGAIDFNGDEVIPFISSIPIVFSEKLAHISIIDPNKELNLTAQSFKKFNPTASGFTGFKDGNKIISKDKKGNIYNRDSVEFSSKNHLCGYVTTKNQLVIEMKYDMAFPFVDGLACVCVDTKYGFINPKGEYVVPPIYEDAGDFKCGLAKVRKNGKWGYINKKGEVEINFNFDGAFDFNEYGVAKIIKNHPEHEGEFIEGIIDLSGYSNFFESHEFLDWDDEDEIEYGNILYDYSICEFIPISFYFSDTIFYVDVVGDGLIIEIENCIEAYPFENGIAKVEFKTDNQFIREGYICNKGNKYWEDD